MAAKQKGTITGRGKVDYDVVLIGDVFFDIATMPVRDYPERDRQMGCEFMLSIGGQAGNCAAACASLGLNTALVCKTGSDVLSKWIISELQKSGVDCFATTSELPYPGITVSISFEDGSRSMLSDRGANLDLKREDIEFDLLTRTRFLMRAGHWNTEGLFTTNEKILRVAKSAGVHTGVDIGWSAYLGWTEAVRQTVFDFLPYVDFLFVNEAEIRGLSGKERGEHELLERGCENVIVHRGVKGSSWINRDFELHCPAFKVKPVSPTGVGDVFNAGFIYAFLEGKDAEGCLRFANACAAIHISKKRWGNVFPAIKDVKVLININNIK